MLLLHAQNLKKFYGDRQILEIPEFRIYQEDRFGVVGINGAGKSTLLNILAGKDRNFQGQVKSYTRISYIEQQDDGVPELLSQATDYNAHQLSEFGVIRNRDEGLSGGEKSRLRLALNFDDEAGLLFADEPTSNLDLAGIELVEAKLSSFRGGMLLISHDRWLLNHICNSIIEIDRGKVTIYPGNYVDYQRLKQAKYDREMFEYNQYSRERQRLIHTIDHSARRIKNLKKTPSRMGNSEARLHRRTTNQIQGNMSTKLKAMETRLENLEKKERPKDPLRTKIEIPSAPNPFAKTIVQARNLKVARGNKVLLWNVSFQLEKGKITALIGPNGSGKSTLASLIYQRGEGLTLAQGLKPGWLNQDFLSFDQSQSILANVMKNSIQNQTIVRTVLARLLFRADDVYKEFGLLSGGEKLKVAIAALIVADVNFLILDEPTNYLDIYSTEAMEQVLKSYAGSILLISHDRMANRLLIINNKHLLSYSGTYTEYKRHIHQNTQQNAGEINRTILQMRLAAIAGKLNNCSDLEKPLLEQEYNEIVAIMKSIR